jgi:glycosyltransferase involved in cell wall biosynthesis
MESHTISSLPFISIILPTYNRAHLVIETIDSILNQSYIHWELIVIDDGSDDDTATLICKIKDDRIKYFKLNHTGKLGEVRNAGLEKATGELIAFADSDDLWRYDKLAIQVRLLQEHKQAKFIISDGEVFGEINGASAPRESFFEGSLVWPILQEKRFVFYTPSWLFRRNALESVGMIDETLSGGSEFEFFLRMCAACKGIFTNERLVKIRRHAGNLTANPAIGINRYSNMMQIVKNLYYAKHLTTHQYRLLMSNYQYKIGLFYSNSKDYKHAVSNFIGCIKFTPWQWKAWIRLVSAGFRHYI